MDNVYNNIPLGGTTENYEVVNYVNYVNSNNKTEKNYED